MITTPIDQDLADKLKPGAGIITEVVDFEPGEQIAKDAINRYKAGSGARGHVYVVYWTADPKNDVAKVAAMSSPYDTRKHNLGLAEREKASKLSTPAEINKNERYVKEKITPLIERLQSEIKLTRPVHNYNELRAITGSPNFDILAFKFLSNYKIQHDPQIADEFRKEYTLHSKMHHPSIPRFVRFIETDKGIGYLYGFVDGETLEDIVKEDEDKKEVAWWRKSENGYREFLPPATVLAIMTQFYGALAHMHKKGVLYQDIQPGNLMIGFDGTAYVIDFGFTDEITKDKKTIESGGGDEHFFGPEVICHLEEEGRYGFKIKQGHQLPLNLKSGVFSAGDVAYFLMTGRYPFEGPSFSQLADNIMSKKHTDPRAFNPEYTKELVEWLVNKPLAKDSEKRPSPSEIAYQLQKLSEKEVGNKSSEDVVYEFMRPHEIEIAKAFVQPDVKLPEFSSPRRKGGSRPFR